MSAGRQTAGRPRPDGLDGVGLHLGYHDRAVVHGADIALRAGRVTALVGPNSSGKSTLLRALARLHRLTAGELALQSGADRVDALALGAREFARQVTLLAQSRPTPPACRCATSSGSAGTRTAAAGARATPAVPPRSPTRWP